MHEGNGARRLVKAFDKEAIHAGNKGLAVDHPAVAIEVEKLLAGMTLEQKINEMHGLQPMPVEGFYLAGGDDSLGIPVYRMADGPRGARVGKATAFPVAIARGATFNPQLERQVGLAAGSEIAAKGGNVILAPTINLLRHPGWGRAQETYSEDPWHMGAMGVAFISGAQNHVLTSPKHFALNNLEMTRFEMSANVDLRTLHEVYLPHFKRCVVEGAAGSLMSAYNKVNGVYCGEHPLLLTDVLREQWGFRGFVESDWFLGTRSTAEAINAGMDIEMPGPYRYEDQKIDEALAAGNLLEETITRNTSRVLYQKIAFELQQASDLDESIVESKPHRELARVAAEQSFVLLKNDGDVLPLEAKQRIAVIGDLADAVNLGDRGSSMVTATRVVTPLAGFRAYRLAKQVTYFRSSDELKGLSEFDVCVIVAGLTYREEGEFIPTQQKDAEEDNELARGGDRTDLRLPQQQEALIQRVADQARKTVVLLEGGSAIEVAPWVDQVDALMMIWYPGCEGGHAIARVLFGDVNPSGRLPVTFPRSIKQLMDWDVSAVDVQHDLYHGYRYLDRNGETAQYPFGYGLSYSIFSFDGFHVERTSEGFLLKATVTNVGQRVGASIPQIYASQPDSKIERVAKELKGFGRVEAEPGESVDLEIEILDQDLCYYDPEKGWTLEACSYEFWLADSADDLQLRSAWSFDGKDWQPL